MTVPAMVEQLYQLAKDEASQEFAAEKARFEQTTLELRRALAAAEDAQNLAENDAHVALSELSDLKSRLSMILVP